MFKEPNPRLVCKDGVSLSIQASEYTYCTPRDNEGPYTHFEVGFIRGANPSEEWLRYSETGDFETQIYAYVPKELIREFIVEHGGPVTKKEEKLEFVSYDGSFPNLCRGTLVIKIDDQIIEFKTHSLNSGGSVSFDENWMEEVTSGKWDISSHNFPKEVPQHLYLKIINLVNENVPQGCCGGCV